MTVEEKAEELAFTENGTFLPRGEAIRRCCIEMAYWKDKHPSDETIMLILNCIGYEEASWLDFVKKRLEKE